MLTMMDSVWLNETGEQTYRRFGNFDNDKIEPELVSPWPVSLTTDQTIPHTAKPFTVCNANNLPLKQSQRDLETQLVPRALGHVCLSIKAHPNDHTVRKQLGPSKCQYYLNATYGWDEPDNIREEYTQSIFGPEAQRATKIYSTGIYLGGKYFPRIRFSSIPTSNLNFALPMGLYWVCGVTAYTSWPDRAIGTCYIAAVTPAMYNLHKEHFSSNKSHRHKRGMTYTPGGMTKYNGYVMANPWTGQGATVGLTFSLWGRVIAALQKIKGLAFEVQGIANETANAMTSMNSEIKHMRSELFTQRLALDLVFAQERGLCKVVNTSCCFLIPDEYDGISKYIENLRHAIPNPPLPTAFDNFLNDFEDRFGATMSKILMAALRFGLPFLVPVIVLLIIVFIVKYMLSWFCNIMQRRARAANFLTMSTDPCANENFVDVFPFSDEYDIELQAQH